MIDGLTKEECKKLLIVMLITDGSYCLQQSKYPKFAYCGNDNVLHEIFIKMMKKAYDIIPSYREKDQTMYQRLEYIKIYHDLLRYCVDLNKKSDIIRLDFLKDESKKIQKYALRLAMSAEGSISISRNDKGSLRGNLAFACANPNLCEQWARIFNNNGIAMKMRRNKYTYSKIHGLQVVDSESIHNFVDIGGFIPSVRVQKGSKFKGYDKNCVLGVYKAFWKNIKDGKLVNYTKWPKAKFENELNYLMRGVRGGM